MWWALGFLEEGLLAAALGDGRVAFIKSESTSPPSFVSVHDGPCLSLAVDLGEQRVLTGGDDARLVSTDTDGETTEIAAVAGRWVEPDCRQQGIRAMRCGLRQDSVPFLAGWKSGRNVRSRKHGRRSGIRPERAADRHRALCGVSLWWAKPSTQKPKRLDWSGSHLGLTWSPDGKYIVTATQENELHGWRVSDGDDMRMSGYPTKVKSMSWLPKGKYLATGGDERVVCWPFHGKDGPVGKAPLDLGWGFEGVVTVVAAHPRHDVVAAGYEDGATILVQIDRADSALVKRPGEGAVTALAWSADGQHLALGTESGFLGRISLSDWRTPS